LYTWFSDCLQEDTAIDHRTDLFYIWVVRLCICRFFSTTTNT